ncbi:MAG: amidohydrolase family protein [Marinobacterium sp.]
MINITDPHLHLFNLADGEYGWLQPNQGPDWPDKSALLRNFTESDLRLSEPLSLAGYAHIEAGFSNDHSWLEIDWIESQASLPIRTIGCINLCASQTDFSDSITQLLQRSSMVGVRHIFDEQLDSIISHTNTFPNLKTLESNGLLFELQFDATDEVAVDKIISLMKQLPSLTVVLDHQGFGSTALSDDQKHHWLSGLTKLAELPNLYVKCSGFEMLDRGFTAETLQQTVEQLVSLFGQSRVMMASNFPLITFSMSYSDYWSMVVDVLNETSLPMEKLVDLNAREIYRF